MIKKLIDKETVEKIKDAADIVDVVSDYVHLTRRGANYMGLCPFHNERTPSFSVNKSRNFCYCFSCHKGGSPVNFIMEKEGISYHDALLHLAKKYNIEVQERDLSPEEMSARNEREAMAVTNEWAAKEMAANLTETDEGRNVGLSYLRSRGVTAEAITRFRLGYAIDRGDALSEKARKSGFDLETLMSLGLVGKSQQGNLYDRFRGRVIFPIINPAGRVVGFGGRDLKGGPAKYVNSPESALYKKSNELYGIFQAKSEIVRRDKCFLVEGYLDVIGLWQAGMQNVVASSGTALTDGQIALIHRFTSNITLIYDGDPAGIKASLRGIDMLLKHRMQVKVLLLPDGHDPDSFAASRSAEEFQRYIDEHETDIIRYQTQVLLDEAGKDPQKRIAAANAVVRSISAIPDQLTRAIYIKECADIFGLEESAVAKAVETRMLEDEKQYRKEKEKEQLRRMAAEKGLPQSKAAPQEPSSTPGQSGTQSSPYPVGSAAQSGPDYSSQQVAPLTAAQGQRTSLETRDTAERQRLRIEGLERDLAEICVRRGLSVFYDYLDEETNQRETSNVVRFIIEELEADDLSFSTPVYARLIKTLADCQERYEKEVATFAMNVEQDIEQMRREKTEEIASTAITMQGIANAEKKMEEEFAIYRTGKLQEYACAYSGKILASHEDDEIRRMATELLYDRNTLSRMYTKDLRPEDIRRREEENVQTLVLKKLSELKNEIFEQRISERYKEMMQAAAEGASPETITGFQLELKQLYDMRRSFAHELGERIIAPRK